jgi:glutamate--cysteine ligase
MNRIIKTGLKYFKLNEKNSKNWKIGFEIERFAIDNKTRLPLSFNETDINIQKILKLLVKDYNFSPVYYNNILIGAKTSFADISIEPGSQFEIAFQPYNNFDDLIKYFIKINEILLKISNSLNFSWLCTGFNPYSDPEKIICIPKDRYHYMENYLPNKGKYALHMMKSTASIQTSIDYENEIHFKKILKFTHLIAPVITGWLGNSPFINNEGLKLNFRNHIWNNVDKDRCGCIPKAVQGEVGYIKYLEFLQNIPLLFSYGKDNILVPFSNIKKPIDYYLEINKFTKNDLELLLSCIFTICRAKNYIEFRIFDCLPLDLSMFPPLLSSILFYSDNSLNMLEDLFKDFSEKDMLDAFPSACNYGMQGIYKNRKIQDLSQDIFQICYDNINTVRGIKINSSSAEKILFSAKKLILKKSNPAKISINKDKTSENPGIFAKQNFITDSSELIKLLTP